MLRPDHTSTTTMTASRWASRLLLLAAVAVLLLGLLATVQPAGIALAQQPTPTDDEVNRIAKRLYCPVCENTPLDVCPTEACRQWRDLIRQQLSDGWTQERIEQYFVEQYGARVLSEPPRTGLNWIVYVLPPLIIVAGLVILVRSLRAWKTPAPESAAGASADSASASKSQRSASTDEYVSRLEEELKKRS